MTFLNMMKLIVVSHSFTESQESACPFCQNVLHAGEHAVQCSECKSLHHVDCWLESNNRCAVLGCSGSGEVEGPLQPPDDSPIIGALESLPDLFDSDIDNPHTVKIDRSSAIEIKVPNFIALSDDINVNSTKPVTRYANYIFIFISSMIGGLVGYFLTLYLIETPFNENIYLFIGLVVGCLVSTSSLYILQRCLDTNHE